MEAKYDFLELLKKFFIFSKKVLNYFIEKIFFQIQLFFHYKILVIIITLLTIIITIINFIYKEKTYVSEMTIQSNIGMPIYLYNHINTLNNYDKNTLVRIFELDSSYIGKIKKINVNFTLDINSDGSPDVYFNKTKKLSISDSLFLRKYAFTNNLVITAEVSDNKLFTNNLLSNSLVNYINSNSYFISYNQNRITTLNNVKQITEKELEKLQLYQEKEYFEYRAKSENTNEIVLTNNQPDEKLLHVDIINLNNDLLKIKTELELRPEIISLINPFSYINNYKQNIWKDLIVNLFLMFIFDIGLLNILYANRKN